LIDLTGTASGGTNPTSITNSAFNENYEFELRVSNSTGTLTDFVMSNNTFSATGSSGSHGDLVSFQALGTASMKLSLTGGSFTGINVNQGIAGQATSKTTNATITNNIVRKSLNNRAIIVQQNNSTNPTSAGTTCVDISGNEMNNIAGNVGDLTKIRFRELTA